MKLEGGHQEFLRIQKFILDADVKENSKRCHTEQLSSLLSPTSESHCGDNPSTKCLEN